MRVSGPRVVVVGGGLSGLATAFLLKARGVQVEILEEQRFGGKIASELVLGYLCEHGPQGFLDSAPDTMVLLGALGLESVAASPVARRRFLYLGGRLQTIPERPQDLLRSSLLSVGGKLRLLAEPWARAPSSSEEESVFAFTERRLGKQVAQRLVSPMVAGIYAGDPKQLSVACAFPKLVRMQQEAGSILRGLRQAAKNGIRMGALRSFTSGMEALPRALVQALGESSKNEGARAIERSSDGLFRIRGERALYPADAVVVAAPPDQAAKLLGEDRVGTFGTIPFAAVDVCCLGYARGDIEHALDGFGFLVAPDENLHILGCLFESSMFEGRAPAGQVLLRVMLGGARHPEMAAWPDEKVIATARSALERSLGARAEPRQVRLVRYAKAIPQYTLGHGERVAAAERAEAAWPGLFITGNALRGVGINDCIREAYRVAERVAQYLGSVPTQT